MHNRRSVLAVIAAVPFFASIARAQETNDAITIHKDPNCGCCQAWADRLAEAGFSPRMRENKAMNRLKGALGVPHRLAACHTAEIGGYVIEGHVPPAEIQRLLREKPAARGLAVAGMPVNSPGMEVPGAEEEAYDVILFGAGADRVYARYTGSRAL